MLVPIQNNRAVPVQVTLNHKLMRGDGFCSSSESHVVWFLLLWAKFLQIKGTEGHPLSGNTVPRSQQYYGSIFLFWQVKQHHFYKWKQLKNSTNLNNIFVCILSFINEIVWSGETFYKNAFSFSFSVCHRVARKYCKIYSEDTSQTEVLLCQFAAVACSEVSV